jgi:hypothetical protein
MSALRRKRPGRFCTTLTPARDRRRRPLPRSTLKPSYIKHPAGAYVWEALAWVRRSGPPVPESSVCGQGSRPARQDDHCPALCIGFSVVSLECRPRRPPSRTLCRLHRLKMRCPGKGKERLWRGPGYWCSAAVRQLGGSISSPCAYLLWRDSDSRNCRTSGPFRVFAYEHNGQ